MTTTVPADTSRFPDPVYRDTVLAPLFDHAKRDHVAGFRAIDRAHLVMLRETGILDERTARDIAAALVAIDREIDPAGLTYTGEVEDFFFLIEKELKQRLGPDTGGRLHTARSRNDIDHTLFKLALKTRIDDFLRRAAALAETLLAVAGRERGTLIVAYTHGQPAQPSTFGHYLAAYAEVLLRDMERMLAAREIVDLCPMGAAAITTSGFPINRERMAELLGFARPLVNSYGCIAAVDYQTATYSALQLFALHIGRLIQDLQVWTAFEVGQIHVPDSLVQISSIMPQKRNPVPIEHLRHLASQTCGRAGAMLLQMHNTPFTDMNDSEGETQSFGYEAFAVSARVLDLMAALAGKIRVDAARVRQNIRRSAITITELADSLVREEGLSFRQAHEIAAHVARTVVAAGGGLAEDGEVPFRAAFAEAMGRPSRLTSADFARIVSPEHFITVRDRTGGPAPAALAAALNQSAAVLAQMQARMTGTAAREALAARQLAERFNALVGA